MRSARSLDHQIRCAAGGGSRARDGSVEHFGGPWPRPGWYGPAPLAGPRCYCAAGGPRLPARGRYRSVVFIHTYPRTVTIPTTIGSAKMNHGVCHAGFGAKRVQEVGHGEQAEDEQHGG